MIDFIIQTDHTIAHYFATHQALFSPIFMSLITMLGDWWLVLVLLGIFFLVLEDRHKHWRIGALLFGFMGTQTAVFALKYMVGRARPTEQVHSLLQSFTSTPSFPSGHSATAMAFYGLLTYFIVTSEKNKTMQIIFSLSGGFLIATIGFSRMYLGLHYLSDVIAGFFIGGIFLFLSIQVSKRRVPKFVKVFLKKIKTKWGHLNNDAGRREK